MAAGVLFLSAALHADTYPRQPGVDAIHYVFRLAVEDTSNRISGEATITLRLSAPVKEVSLDLTSAVDGKGMTVAAVTAAGGAASFTHAADRLQVPLPAARAGEEIEVVVTYSGVPAEGLRLIDNIHGERTMFSENWPNRDSERLLKPR